MNHSIFEVISDVANKAGVPKPLYSVPYPAGYLFGWFLETLNPILPGSSPFLTRSSCTCAKTCFVLTIMQRINLVMSPAKTGELPLMSTSLIWRKKVSPGRCCVSPKCYRGFDFSVGERGDSPVV